MTDATDATDATDVAALTGLMRLAEARRSGDLARIEALMAEDRALARELAEAGATPRLDIADGAAQTPFAQQALRLAWAQARVEQALRRRAELALEIDAARSRAARSLGRHEALAHLRDRAATEARRARAARAEREAPVS